MAVYSFLIVLLACLFATHATPINKIPDNYDINENMIPDEDVGDIEGLLPPLETSVDYYSTGLAGGSQEPSVEVRNSSYIMDTISKVFRLANSRDEDKDTEPSQADKDFMEQMAQGFASLFGTNLPKTDDDSNRRPVFKISSDGLSLEFAATDDKIDEVNVREETSAYTTPAIIDESEGLDRTTLQDDMTTSEEPMQSDEAQPRSDDSDAGTDFLKTLWDTVKTSLEYASRLIFGGDQPAEKSSADSVTTVAPSSSNVGGGLVALEEPLTRHHLPSQEFEKGGRDVDALLYGRGIA